MNPPTVTGYYELFAPPRTLDELLLLTPIPSFKDDPARRGMVVLDPAWVKDYIVNVDLPLFGPVRCHRAMVAAMQNALQEILETCGDDPYIDEKQSGMFVPRRTLWTPGNRLSVHAIGFAHDINWDENPMGKKDTPLCTYRQDIVRIFQKHGFTWGGDWKNPDPMHFQYMSARVLLPR